MSDNTKIEESSPCCIYSTTEDNGAYVIKVYFTTLKEAQDFHKFVATNVNSLI